MNSIRHDPFHFNLLKMNSKALRSEGVKNGDFSNAFELSEMSTGDIE